MRNNLKADERRDLTVETVVKLCSEEDPAEITTGKIASKMEVTQGALFRHFPTKDSIWESVADWVAKKIMRGLDNAVKTDNTPLLALEEIFYMQIQFISKHPGIPRILLGRLQTSKKTKSKKIISTLLTQYKHRLEALLREGKSGKEFNPNLDEEAAAIQFIGMIQGLVINSLIHGGVSQLKQDAPRLWKLYLSGICHD